MLHLAGVVAPGSFGRYQEYEARFRIAREHPDRTIAIAFGSPYILHELAEVSTFICALIIVSGMSPFATPLPFLMT